MARPITWPLRRPSFGLGVSGPYGPAPTPATIRVTEAAVVRVTEAGVVRVTESP